MEISDTLSEGKNLIFTILIMGISDILSEVKKIVS